LDNIYEYYEDTVKPTVEEFLINKTNLRKGRLAAIVLDHMRDYRGVQLGIKAETLLEQIKVDCFDLVLIRDVCNASKHCSLTGNSANNPKVKNPRNLSKASDIKSENNAGIFGAPFGSSEALFGESNYVYMKLDREVSLSAAEAPISSRVLHESINEVMKYWDKTLYSE
jgi:hypothetical protein